MKCFGTSMQCLLKLQLVARVLLVILMPSLAIAKDRERIANEGTIGDKWMLASGTNLASAQYPIHQASRGSNVCIALVTGSCGRQYIGFLCSQAMEQRVSG